METDVRKVIDFMIAQDFGRYTFEYLFNFKFERMPTSFERDEFDRDYQDILESNSSYEEDTDASISY
jgi:hypothetical protein